MTYLTAQLMIGVFASVPLHMPTLPALLLAAAALPPLTAPLARDAIFPAHSPGRPAISSSGKWLAVEGAGGHGMRLVPTTLASAPLDVALPPGLRVYWYRWARSDADTLTVAAGGASDEMFSYDLASRTLSRVTTNELTPAFLVALPTNNFAFTYNRFRNKVAGTFSDLGPDGILHASVAASRDVPGYLARDGRYFELTPGRSGWTISAGAEAASRSSLVVSPEDQRLGGGLASMSRNGVAYVLSSDGADTLGLVSMDMQSGTRKLLLQAPVDIRRVIIDPVTFEPDAVEYDAGAPELVLLNQKIAPDIKLLSSRGDGFPAIVDRSPNDRYWVIQYAHRAGTPRMTIYDRQLRTSTALPAAAFKALESPDWRVRPFSLKGANGTTIGGYVTLPRAGVCEATPCPAVLKIHGGPGERDYAKFDYERFWLTSRGIAVISVNYRGSRGFGKKFMALDAMQWDDGIPKDVRASLAHVLDAFPIDRTRIAAMGSSFSGYLMLNMAASGTPFRCAVIDSASTDIVKFAERRFRTYGESSDILKRVGDARIAQQKAAMLAMSPSSHVPELAKLPVLHFHGGRDDTTVKDDSDEFVAEMLAANRNYTFVEMPDEGHGLLGARAQYREIAEAFLGQCLGVATEPVSVQSRAAWSAYRISGNLEFLKP